MLEAADLAGAGNIDVGAGGGGGGAAGRAAAGGGLDASQFQRLNRLLTTQVFQMGRMASSFEELRDVADDLSDSQRGAMSAADKAADSFDLTNIRMSDMHNAMAAVIPMLIVFVGTMPAAITALAALATAALAAAGVLGLLGGIGLMGAGMQRGDGDTMQGLSEIFQEIQEDFVDAFEPLADAFAPLIRDAIDGLDRMFQEIASFGDLFRGLQDEMRAFGSFMSEFIRDTIRDMARMTEAFAPIFGMIGAFIEDMDLMRNLSQFMADILPQLKIAAGLVVNFIQRLIEMSKGFLDVAVIVGMTVSTILKFLSAIGLTEERLGVLIGVTLTAVTVMNILSASLWSAVIPALVTVGTRVLALISTLTGYSASSIVATLATMGLAKAFIVLVGAITLGIGALVAVAGITAALGSSFGGLTDDIDSATESLKNFRRQQQRMDGGDNPYRNPDIRPGQNYGTSRFGSGGQVNVTIEGDADDESVRNQTQNALYRMERPSRSR
jgi:hypothetical protein